MTPPNILFVMFDQMSALSLASYGHRLVKTPHLDRLAARGTVFQHAYCASPLCSPSRFAMLTSRLPSRIGAYDNAAELPSEIPTLLHYLRVAGYRTCLSGKMDFTGADQLHGYEERLTTDLSPSDFGWTPDWRRPDEVQPWYHTLQSVREAGPCDYSLSMQYDEEAAFKGVQWLHQVAGRPDGRPFMLTVSFMHPHDPYQAPQRFWDLYDQADIDMPLMPAAAAQRRDAAGERMYRLYDRDEIAIDAAHVRNARHAYYGMISYVDDLLGKLLATLDTLGVTENTIVIATSDHGDMLGERGLWYKMTFFERAVRVPLLLSGPGIGRGRRIPAPVSHLDILPTVVELVGAGRDPSEEPVVEGRSLAAALRGGQVPDGAVLGEYSGEGYDKPLIMIRDGQWKFVYSDQEVPALYDLASDPLEQNDLASDSSLADVLSRFLDEANRRWDLASIRTAVLESQARRRLVHQALTAGKIAPWDFEPRADPASLYYRNYRSDRPDPDHAVRLPRRPA